MRLLQHYMINASVENIYLGTKNLILHFSLKQDSSVYLVSANVNKETQMQPVIVLYSILHELVNIEDLE